MEKKLKALFEFQRFQNNDALAALIAETEGRDSRRLTEEDLSFVHAAGTGYVPENNERQP